MTKGDFIDFTNTSVNNKYISNTDKTKFFSPYPANETDCQTQQPGIGGLAVALCRPGVKFYDRKLNTTTAKLDLTSQVSYNHQLKAGVSYNYRTLDVKNQYGFYSGTSRYYTTEYYKVHPYDVNAYVSDRMEYAGLIINGGLRFDLWAPNASEFADYYRPYKTESVLIPEDGTYYTYLSALRNTQKIKPRTFISPRLAVSHPVSDNASIYFSFAKIQQNQPLSVMYADYNDISNLSNAIISIVDRDPTISTKYELGGQWAFLDNVSLDVNAYYNNIQNYQSASYNVTALSGAPAITYYYFNAGYANARGVEATLNLFPTKLADFVTVSGRLTYTYSFVRVSAVVGATIGLVNKTAFAVSATDSSNWKYRYALPINDYDNFTRVELPVLSNNSALTGGYDRTHRVNYTMFFRFPYQISLTSIGLFQSGFKYTPKFNDPRKQGLDIKEAPWNTQVDLRLEKAFSFGSFRFAAYLDVKNVFDKGNLLAFDYSTTYSDAWETSKDPTGLQKRPMAGDGTTFYDIPREMYFGITFDF